MPAPANGGDAPLTAFVSFPSPYTQTLLQRALAATLPAVSMNEDPPTEDDPPRLQWADYDLMSFDKPHKDTRYLISSYVYRKALIRKHQLHVTATEYLAKAAHRGVRSALASPASGGVGGLPKGWVIDVQFADELDELLMDDLYELAESMAANESKPAHEREWFILKPGFADRAQGIRMFSTEDELRAIFEEFEPPSDDEEEEEDEDATEELARRTEEVDLDEEGGTAVLTSQLRHFVIQEYLPRPVLFDLQEGKDPSSPLMGQKCHLRAYVLVTGSYTVHLAHTMLALFSGVPYTAPSMGEDGVDLRPHLTNTCLQSDAFGAPIQEDDLVRLFWDLEGQTALQRTADGYVPRGKVTREWLDGAFAKVGDVVAEAVKAGAECGSFNLQLMPNAFEIFGVDLMMSFPPTPASGDSAATSNALPEPDVTLLEFNASPDFIQSGDALRPMLLDMFKGVVRLSIAPFFGIETTGEDDADKGAMQVGEEKWGWRLVGQGEVRGNWS